MNIYIDFSKISDKIRPLHGINNAPIMGASNFMFHYLSEAGIPYSRLHDTGGSYGGGCFVDIANIFRDFSADPDDESSYDFAFTDWLLKELHSQGVKIVYRLGASIENYHNIKAYNIFPPADNLKWAKICEGIIRHYNEGWAEGFHFGIEYWEIWNEPDNYPDIEDNQMWKGTKEQYFALYETASNYLKLKFPDIKIGGYSSCGFYAILENEFVANANSSSRTGYFIEFAKDFFDYITSDKHKSPIDFFSWHSYSDAEANVKYAGYARELLDSYGLYNTESHLNEWNPGVKNRGTARDAALILNMMIRLQHEGSIDMMNYYDGQINGSYRGMFNPIKYDVFKAYYSFKIFAEVFSLGNQLDIVSEDSQVSLLASYDGKKSAVALANISDEYKDIEITFVTPVDSAKYYLVDDEHFYDETELSISDDKLNIMLAPDSAALIKLEVR